MLESDNSDSSIINENNENYEKCPNCGSTNLSLDNNGMLVCYNCGYVIENIILSSEYEKRIFSSEDTIFSSRITPPTDPLLKHSRMELLRMIQKEDKELLSYEPSETRLKRKLEGVMIEVCKNLHLPSSTFKTALNMLIKYAQRYSIREKKLKAFVAAALYVAARQTGHPQPIDKILKKTGLSKKEFSKAFKLLRERLKLHLAPISPEQYVISFGKELGLSGKAIKLAIKILKHAYEYGLTIGKDPAGLAAASLFAASIATGEHRSQRRIAEIASITEVTVRTRYKELKKYITQLSIL
ncbi:MAG: transcription initiation factor IIB [Candidatus Njordarchaeales archaeon]